MSLPLPINAKEIYTKLKHIAENTHKACNDIRRNLPADPEKSPTHHINATISQFIGDLGSLRQSKDYDSFFETLKESRVELTKKLHKALEKHGHRHNPINPNRLAEGAFEQCVRDVLTMPEAIESLIRSVNPTYVRYFSENAELKSNLRELQSGIKKAIRTEGLAPLAAQYSQSEMEL